MKLMINIRVIRKNRVPRQRQKQKNKSDTYFYAAR